MDRRGEHWRRVKAAGAVVAVGAVAALAVVDTPGQSARLHAQGPPDTTTVATGNVTGTGITFPASACGEGTFAYSASMLQAAYNMQPLYQQGFDGRGTTIAIVDSFGSPTIKQDLRNYDTKCGVKNPPSFRIITPAGRIPKYNPNNADMTGWAGETTLDVETAHAIAPGAKILLVETPVAETEGVQGFPQIVKAENYVINHHMATVISQSFSATEETFPNNKAISKLRSAFKNAQRHGVTVLAATGDTGATDYHLDGSTPYDSPVVGWPASDPLVTAVGGTLVNVDSQGQRITSDVVWQDGGGAGGGGPSHVFRRPAFQSGVSSVTGKWRGIPDISMSASPQRGAWVWESDVKPGWNSIGGTSEATPLFAGLVAVAAQIKGRPLGDINPSLYRMARAAASNGIADVTEGNNGWGPVLGFSAKPGYDMASGVGTPANGDIFAHALARSTGKSLG